MTDKKNERRGQNRTRYQDGGGDAGFAREYSYVLHLSPDERTLLDSHRTALAAGSARFAEVHYNYLHDNPDIADVLYAHERSGGNVGELIRSELELILGVFSPNETDARERTLVEAGRTHLHRGIRPAWVTGAYRLFLEYVLQLVRELPATAADRDRLEVILLRQIMRDQGLMIEGYFARLMYLSLYKMHLLALHGYVKVGLGTLARIITRRTEPQVKLLFHAFPYETEKKPAKFPRFYLCVKKNMKI